MIREISLYSNNSRLTDIHPLEKLSLTIISLIGASYINNNYILSVNILFFIILNILSKNPDKEKKNKNVPTAPNIIALTIVLSITANPFFNIM